MSDHKVNQEQEKEIQGRIGSRLQNGRIDYDARLRQSMERGRLEAGMTASANSTSNSSQDNFAGNSAAIAEQTRHVLVTNRPIAVGLWEHFENVMDNFDGDIGVIWNEFTAMTPWEKVVIVLGIFALFFLIGGLGYFSWPFVYYVWPNVVAFARTYGPTISAYGINFLSVIENSDIYQNFVTNFQNNDENMNADGLGAMVTLGMPPMLALYKTFFGFLSTQQGSG